MLTLVDYIVIAAFFVFFIGLGFFFRRFSKNSSEYFRGGGQMSWWLVGASAFMSCFSAWTFTGGASVAYTAGIVVLVIYLGNALGFVINGFWSASRFRQMRVITVMEAVRTRLGASNEQFFMWINLPLQILGGGIWLYGLAIFCAPVFGLNMVVTLLLCGIVVTIVACTGGAWAVAASDFLQVLMLLPITIVIAFYCLYAVGGPVGLVERVPAESFDLTASHLPAFGVLWVIAILIEKMISFNSLQIGGARYLAVRDGREARWAAFLAAGLFVFGSLLWFIPPLTARAMNVDLGAEFPGLSQPAEGAYVSMAIRFLPNGLLGLMVTGMLAATMSSMNESLNRNAGIFVRSFYLPMVRKDAGERELVWMGRLVTLLLGGLVILIALFYSSLKGMGIFDLLLIFSAMLVIPTFIPLFWCLFLKRNPDWMAWLTVLFGLVVSLTVYRLPSISSVVDFANAYGWSGILNAIRNNGYMVLTLVNVCVGSIFFLGLSRVFRGRQSVERQAKIEQFFDDFERPLSAEEKGTREEMDAQSVRIGRLALFYAGFVALLLLVPNPWTGRLAVLFCAGFIGLVGFLLILAGRPRKVSATPEE